MKTQPRSTHSDQISDISERLSNRHMSELGPNSPNHFNESCFDIQPRSWLNRARYDSCTSLQGASEPPSTVSQPNRRPTSGTPGLSTPLRSPHQLPMAPNALFSSPGKSNGTCGSGAAATIRQKLAVACTYPDIREPAAAPVEVLYLQDPLDSNNQIQWVISGPNRFDKSYFKTLCDDNMDPSAIDNHIKQPSWCEEITSKGKQSVSEQQKPRNKRRCAKEAFQKQKRFAVAQKISQSGKTFAGNGPMEHVKQKYTRFDGRIPRPRISLEMDMETAEDTIIGRIHEPMPPNTREWLEAWKSDDPEVCCVCLNDDCSSSNSFVYCSDESCEVIVHQNCYAIHKLPSKQEPWYCDRCAAIREDETCLVSCALCPSTIGAFRKLKVPHHGIQWVHVICALRIRGVKISNSRNVSGITVPDQESKSWKGQCSICENPLLADYGAYQICSEGGCTKKLHVTCAMKYSAHVDAENLWTMRCLDHHTSGELTVNQWEKWVDRRDEHLKSKASALCQEAWKAAIERTGPKNLVECSIVFSHLVKQTVQTQTMDILTQIEQIDNTIAAFQRRLRAGKFSNITSLYSDFEIARSNIQAISEARYKLERLYVDTQLETALIFQRAHINFLKNRNHKRFDAPLTPLSLNTANTLNRSSSVDIRSVSENSERFPTSLPILSLESDQEDSSDSALSDGVGEIQSDGAGETQSDGVDTAQKPKATSTHERNVASPKPASQVTSGKAKSRTSSASQRGTPDSDIPDPKSGSPSKKTSDRPKESAVNGLGQRKRWLEPIIESLRKHEKEGPLKCSECGQETVPTQTIESLGITDDDILALNESKKTRVYGFTGSGKLWDPRVFIECTKCNKLYHCGCIDPPVKNYPSRHELYVCQDCDTAGEEATVMVAIEEQDNEKNLRQRQRINYKV